MYFAIILAGLAHGPINKMQKVAQFGDFISLQECLALSALLIDHLNTDHPKKDFRVACVTNPGDSIETLRYISLDMQTAADLAVKLNNKEK